MSSFDSILSFIEGVKSVIDVSGAIQGTISDAISSGIRHAFSSIKKQVEHALVRIAVMLLGVFFMIWGGAQFIDNFMPYRGLGFIIIGALCGIGALVFLKGDSAA
ncbi:MAG: hypothetical protein WCX64_02270 [Candidatus Micrarchaeia archaeon]|jgi:hypothetical protein